MPDYRWASRLRDVFGVPLQDVMRAHIEALVTAGAQEHDDLDFKSALYGTSEVAKTELASDIAAMRNDVAGVIVVGVEDENGVAVGTPEVELSDGEEGRMRQIVASRTAPHAAFEIQRVPGESDTRGFYLLIAAPSAQRPHAVVVDRNLRYPRRDGTTTRYLSEPEVADTYRDRFRGEGQQLDRLDTITNEPLAMVEKREAPWLVAALVPNLAGSMPISFAGRNAIEQWVRSEHASNDRVDGFYGGTSPMAGVGVDRYTLATVFENDGRRPTHVYAECHTDGAAAAGVVFYRRDDEGEGTLVFTTDLVERAVRALRLIGRHAVANAPAYGDAAVELRLVGENMSLGFSRDGFPNRYAHSLVFKRLFSKATLPLSTLAGDPQDVFAAAKIMLGQIFNGFGRAEVPHIADDGTLRLRYWGGAPEVAAWAEQRGVETSTEQVPE